MRSFAIVTNRPVDSFSPEIDAYGVDGAPLEFRCEGEIPAHGFRCVAKQPARLAYAQGSLTVPTEPCGKTPLRVAIVAAGADGQVGQARRLGARLSARTGSEASRPHAQETVDQGSASAARKFLQSPGGVGHSALCR